MYGSTNKHQYLVIPFRTRQDLCLGLTKQWEIYPSNNLGGRGVGKNEYISLLFYLDSTLTKILKIDQT